MQLLAAEVVASKLGAELRACLVRANVSHLTRPATIVGMQLPRGRPGRFHLALPLFAVLVLAGELLAQGAGHRFANPISARDLSQPGGWADDLGLSEGQRTAAASLHEDYTREFHELRRN